MPFLCRVLRDAYGYDDWPIGRGIFFSHNKKFLVWVNEEDHLRIISMQQGGNLAEVWQRLVKVKASSVIVIACIEGSSAMRVLNFINRKLEKRAGPDIHPAM